MSGVHCCVFRTLTSVLHDCGSSNPSLVLECDVDGQIPFRQEMCKFFHHHKQHID
jgi:hypothetical protein